MSEQLQSDVSAPVGDQPARDQIAAKPDDALKSASQPPLSGELMGRDLPSSLAGLMGEASELTFNRPTIATLNFGLHMVVDAKNAAVQDLEKEREQRRHYQDELSRAETRAAVLATQLTNEQQTGKLRALINTIGSVVFGLFPYAGDKLSAEAGVAVALVGALLVGGSFLFKSKVRQS